LKYFLYLLGVILVLGTVLVAIPLFFPKSCNTFEYIAKRDLNKIALAIEAFKVQNNAYPINLNVLVPEYMDRIRRDPWGNRYSYAVGKDNFVVKSLGADSKPGGIESAKDIEF